MPSLYSWGVGSRLATMWTTIFVKVRANEGVSVSDAVAIGYGIVRTTFLLTPKWSNRALGFTVRAVVTNPTVIAVSAIAATGAVVSVKIDPQNGLDNYLGFVTGGILGDRDPSYLSGDPNDSGYFNVPENSKRIARDRAPKNIDLLSRGVVWFQNLADESNEYDDTH